MKIGRNTPCPCGSGKKYKYCCQKKDEEAKRAMSAEALNLAFPEPSTEMPTSQPTHIPPVDPDIQAINDLWDAFENENYEGQIALFLNALEKRQLPDSDITFELLNLIYAGTIEHDERDRFDDLVEMLCQNSPDLYAPCAAFYLDQRMANAVATGRYEDAWALTEEMGAIPDNDIDIFQNALDRLAYHGQLNTLVEISRKAWSTVKNSDEIVYWGIEAFAEQATNFEILHYVENNAMPFHDDPELCERLRFFDIERDPDRLNEYITLLIEGIDIQKIDAEIRASTDFEQKLIRILIAFLGYLRRVENVPYCRGELAREQLQEYLCARRAGDLEPDESAFDIADTRLFDIFERPKRRKRKTHWHHPAHPFCPDMQTLDQHLGNLLNPLNPQHYKIAATIELLPAWLRFLASHNFIDDQQARQTQENLRYLYDALLSLRDKTLFDPILLRNLERAWRD